MSRAPRRVWPRYLGFGIALYVVFLVVTLPASWLAWGLERVGTIRVRLLEPSGTIWRGEGVFAPKVQLAGPRPPRIRWQVSPWSLFTGRARLAIESADPEAQLRSRVSLARGWVAVEELEATLPARMVTAFYGAASYFGPEGTMRVEGKGIDLREGYLAGQLNATWERAELRGMGVRPIGTYRLQASANGKRAEFKVATIDGDLRVAADGDWEWDRVGRVRARGTAELVSPRSDLEPLLPMLGHDRGNGVREFNLVWPLALPRLR